MVMDFFWELATQLELMLLGHWIEKHAVMAAGNAVACLAALLPNQAHVVHGAHELDMPLSVLQVGARYWVLAGAQMPAAGLLVSGNSSVNESLEPGVPMPIRCAVRAQELGGSVNGAGVIAICVTGLGDAGYLSLLMCLVHAALPNNAMPEGMADMLAGWLFTAALAVGYFAFFLWLPAGAAVALARMVTVFIIACPHALGLAIPLVIARRLSIGATNGLLIRNRQALATACRAQFI